MTVEKGIEAPIITGLALGIAFVVLFGLVLSPALPKQKAAAIDLRIESQERYEVGDEMSILVRIRGLADSCVYPHATISDANTGEKVWDSGTTLIICDSDQTRRPVSIDWELGKSFRQNGSLRLDSNPVIIRQAGMYVVSAQFDNHETSRSIEMVPMAVNVAIPRDSSIQDAGVTFQPQQIRVFTGYNNTVRWTNHDIVSHRIAANDKSDPVFYNATQSQLLQPQASFEFTFGKEGMFGYHGEPGPWLTGTVVVAPGIPPPTLLFPRLSEADALDIVTRDTLNKHPGSEVTVYPLSKTLPVMLYYFAFDERRFVIYPEENIFGVCDPAKLACYPEYRNLDIQTDEDRLVYGIQVLAKNEESGDFDNTYYYIISANTGKIVYASESERNTLVDTSSESLCIPNSQGQQLPKKPSLLPYGYHCVFVQGRDEEGIFTYSSEDTMPKGPVCFLCNSKDMHAIHISYSKAYVEHDRTREFQSIVDELQSRGFQARITHINGNIAAVREQCDVCGMSTRIYYDYDGYQYLVESGLPSTTLIPLLQSLG